MVRVIGIRIQFVNIASALTVLIVCIGVFGPNYGKAVDSPSNDGTSAKIILSNVITTTIKPGLFGSNVQWESGGDGIVNRSVSGIDWNTEIVSAAKDAHVNSIRFPGGALSDTYIWKDGIGAFADRRDGLNFSNKPTESLFGTDELLVLTDSLDAQPVITVNFNSFPKEAQEWVRYVQGNNIGKKAVYWEIGNEIYSPSEHGHTSAKVYAQRVNDFARAMKQVDPSLKIGAVLELSFLNAAWMKNVFPHMVTWNDEVLENLSNQVDFASLHFYAPFDKTWLDDNTLKLALSGPQVFVQNIDILKKQLAQHNRMDLELAVTEYNTFFGDKVKLDRRTAYTEGAIFNGLLLFQMIREPQIILANHWSLVNNAVFGMLGSSTISTVEFRPVYTVFKHLAEQQGWSVLASKVYSPGYKITAKGNIPAIKTVPYLDVLVTKNVNSTKIRFNIINRSHEHAMDIILEGYQPILSNITITSWNGIEKTGWNKQHSKLGNLNSGIRVDPFSFTIVEGDMVSSF